MQQEKPFSESCERNKFPILEAIRPILADTTSLLEIGSGTGQHAVFFAKEFPQLSWQTSDRLDNHQGINLWITSAQLTNVIRPIPLDVLTDDWPVQIYDAAFSANTAHIMPWQAVIATFEGLSKILRPKAHYFLYGPFNYDGKFTSDSNAQFDVWLKERGAHQGIRDIEAMIKVGNDNKFDLIKDITMPANNRLLIWQKH